MRIERLHLDGFGHFADSQIGPLDAPITVFLGPNEAGKTTLLAFLRTMLFGFPPRLRAQHYPPLRGGNHGGRLFLIDEQDTRYTVSRSESTRGTALEVVTSDGRQSADEAFLSNALGHASREMFESVFAFSLTELQQLESLDKDQASAQIYSAGMGAAALPGALASLKGRQEALFLPGGSRQTVAATLADLEDVEGRLRSASDVSERYAEIVARLASVQTELQTTQLRLRDQTSRRQKTSNLRQAWDDWLQRDLLQRRLQELPEFSDFPPEAVLRLERLEERLKTASSELIQSQTRLDAADIAVEATAGDSRPFEHEAEIAHLLSSRDRFAAAVADVPKREGELAEIRGELEADLRTLGPGWDEALLSAFDMSRSAHAEIDVWAAELDEAASVSRLRDDEAARSIDVQKDATETMAEHEANLASRGPPPFSCEQLEERRVHLRRSRVIRDNILRNRALRDALQSQVDASTEVHAKNPEGPWTPLVVLASFGAAITAAGFGLGGAAAVLGLLIGAGLLLAAATLWIVRQRSNRSRPNPRLQAVLLQLDESAAEAEELEGTLVETMKLLRDEPADLRALAKTLDEIEAELAQTAAELVELSAAQLRLSEDRKAAERSATRAAAALEAASLARDQLETKSERWREWLKSRNLADNLLPHTVGVVFVQVENARQRARAFAAMGERIEAIHHDIDEYSELVAELAAQFDLQIEVTNPESIVSVATELIGRLESARRTQAEHLSALEVLNEAKTRFETRQQESRQATAQLKELIVSGHADDSEQFRRNAALHAERIETERGISGCEARLSRLVEPADTLERVSANLAATDLATLEAELVLLEAEITAADQLRIEMIREQAKLETELSDLMGDEETSELRARRETLKANLDAIARQWSVLTVARGLMAEARKKYEQERQPAVVRHAGAFFQTVTAGRYRDLISPLGTQKLTVADSDGSRKEPGQLSQGTQEALYLALRFGLIRQFGEQACRLPVIVDEILVNFDPERAQRVARGFADLSATNQVLVFTCHPVIRDLFTAASPDTQVIEIDRIR